MIAYLSGKPIKSGNETIVIVGGVGYMVHVTQETKIKIQAMDVIELYVYTHVKDDAIDLYGFLSSGEKQLFLKLISVDGVGPKTALLILDAGVSAIIKAIQEADVSFFQSIPRVGKKSAQKIIIELKTKLGGVTDIDLSEPQGKEKEVMDALLALGFGEVEIRKTIRDLDIEKLRLEDAVKVGIKKLTNKQMI